MSIWNPQPGDPWYIDPDEEGDIGWTWQGIVIDALMIVALFAMVALVSMGAGYVYGS